MKSTGFSRRTFLGVTVATAAGALAQPAALEAQSADKPRGFYTLAQRGGRWWFITPEGAPFFSLGLNHIDPSPPRYLTNGDLWQRKYGNSMERWLKEAVAPDLRAWGFSSLGWTQEVVTRGPTNHRHSRAFTFEEYQWLDMPYCHQLPFADFHQWEAETRYPDFSSPEFAEWCDLALWHQKTGKPVLLADHAAAVKSADGSQRHDGAGYAETLRRLRELPGCVGYHLCGAYLRNECRKRALRDARETLDTEALAAITAANAEANRWMRAVAEKG